jgi:chromosome segregation ATPase
MTKEEEIQSLNAAMLHMNEVYGASQLEYETKIKNLTAHINSDQEIISNFSKCLESANFKIQELESKLSQLEDHREELIAKVMNLEDKLADIQCKCNPERKHGETSIMCCNECGLPTEKFWTKTQLPKKEEQE